MIVSRHQVSLGALAVVLCLAFPMGVLSLFSPPTTGDQVDAADSILVARIASLQVLPDDDSTVLEFAVETWVAGQKTQQVFVMTVDGRPAVEVGDLVVAMLTRDPDAVLGVYHVEKDPATLQHMVTTPVTGMWTQGVPDFPPVPLALLETAIRVRLGLLDASALEEYEDGDGPYEGTLEEDPFEPNDTVQTGSTVFLDPPKLITGTPLCLTGLTLTPGDVDFFAFSGAALSLLHAETRFPEGVTSFDLDTIVGLFDGNTRELLFFDEDSGQQQLSRLVAPLELQGSFAVGVESEPDEDLDFTGDDGTTTGEYELKLELQKAAFLTNAEDLVAGVSHDGTFIQDFIGFKESGGMDLLTQGVPADGWGLSYDALLPDGLTSVFGGAGDQLSDPGFTSPLSPGSFVLGPFIDENGFNRLGFAKAVNLVPYQLDPRRGVRVTVSYELGLTEDIVKSDVELRFAATTRLFDVLWTRVLDVDLFGVGDDTFFWDFDAESKVKAFAVDTTGNVGNLDPDMVASSGSDVVGDLQLAMVIEHGDAVGSDLDDVVTYPTAFTIVSAQLSVDGAKEAAALNLMECGMTAYAIAVDQDPDTGLYSAFGVGLAEPGP